MNACEFLDIEQGSPEWLSLRKTKITATDAPIIMGVSPWKTRSKLYEEKLLPIVENEVVIDHMQSGLDLEPVALSLFTLQTGLHVEKKVAVRDWTMASLDGITQLRDVIVEVKCAGEKDHQQALMGKVPDHYYPQVQHQIWVTGLPFTYYFSFDGIDGALVKVERDPQFIDAMVQEEKKFYDCLINKNPPEPSKNDYVERNDDLWYQTACSWKEVTQSIKDLQEKEEQLRNQLILLSGGSNSRGAGISLCQIKRKGAIDYSRIPELKSMNLESYRKPEISTWRIAL